jgi:hypothetical protein
MCALSLEDAKAVYRLAIDSRAHDAEGEAWWLEVQSEVAQVLAAPSIGRAASVVEWWHHDWSVVNDSAGAAAGRIRAAARRLRITVSRGSIMRKGMST